MRYVIFSRTEMIGENVLAVIKKYGDESTVSVQIIKNILKHLELTENEASGPMKCWTFNILDIVLNNWKNSRHGLVIRAKTMEGVLFKLYNYDPSEIENDFDFTQDYYDDTYYEFKASHEKCDICDNENYEDVEEDPCFIKFRLTDEYVKSAIQDTIKRRTTLDLYSDTILIEIPEIRFL